MSETVQQVPESVIVVRMVNISDAIGLWLGDLARSGKANRTRDTYSRCLDKFEATLPYHWDVDKISSAECRRFLDLYLHHSHGTRSQVEAILNCFFEWLRLNDYVKKNPMDKIPRTKRRPAESLDVVTITAEDVRDLLGAAKGWTEKLSIAVPAYTGGRRRAIARLLVRDYDRDHKTLCFRDEKGGKKITKPVPEPLVVLLEAMLKALEPAPDDFLVPNECSQRIADRDDRVIWQAVKRVGARAGINVHVHALRAAFAVQYLEQNPGDLEALQPLMGHHSIATTQVYLRRLNREVAMERVRALTW